MHELLYFVALVACRQSTEIIGLPYACGARTCKMRMCTILCTFTKHYNVNAALQCVLNDTLKEKKRKKGEALLSMNYNSICYLLMPVLIRCSSFKLSSNGIWFCLPCCTNGCLTLPCCTIQHLYL